MDEQDLQNRFTYHPPKETGPRTQKMRYEEIRACTLGLALLLEKRCPESREKSLAITHLEEAVFWANASIARHE